MFNFKLDSYVGQVKVSDDMFKVYYDKNGVCFEILEQVDIEYVVLDVVVVVVQVSVIDDDIKVYYEQNQKQYVIEEQCCVSYILIIVKKDVLVVDKVVVKIKVEGLVVQLCKNLGDFVKLVKVNLQDLGLVDNGGDLGYFSCGVMVKFFVDVVFSLKQGEISDLVEFDFGYYVIEVIGIKLVVVKLLELVKVEIGVEIKKQIVVKKYLEMVDQFNNLVYENGDSFKVVFDKFKLKIQIVLGVICNVNLVVGVVLYNNVKFLVVLFIDDVIKVKYNIEVVQIVFNILVVGCMISYKLVVKCLFEEVKVDVQKVVLLVEEQLLVVKVGQECLVQL